MTIKRLINANSIQSKIRKMLFATSTLHLFLIFFHYLSGKEMNISQSPIDISVVIVYLFALLLSNFITKIFYLCPIRRFIVTRLEDSSIGLHGYTQ